MHICPGNVAAIGRAVVYYAGAAHTFSAGIKYRHCRYMHLLLQTYNTPATQRDNVEFPFRVNMAKLSLR